jgi:putative transposase
MEYLGNMGLEPDEGFLQEALQQLTQTVVELEAAKQIGAGRYERSPERKTYRNGHRDRVWETRVGEIPLRIPKVRDGSYFPSMLEPRRRSEKALLAVVQQAYVEGVSTRRVDDLLQALGLTGIDKSRVSRICKELDEVVEPFRNRPLEGTYPFIWLDALYLKVRHNHRIVSQALVTPAPNRRCGVATGVRESGEREVLGFALGASEEEAFWLDFLRSLVRRGLKGVQLVTSDAHEGLKKALEQALAGVSWQRCRVHFMRNLLAHVPRGDKSIVAAALRTIFAPWPASWAGNRIGKRLAFNWQRWCRPCSAAGLKLPSSWQKLKTTSWPTWSFRPSFGRGSTRQTRWNDSTRRSSAGPMRSGSFPMVARSPAWLVPSCWRSPMSGRSGGVTSASRRWPG